MLAYLAADDRFLGLNRGDWGFLFGASALVVAMTLAHLNDGRAGLAAPDLHSIVSVNEQPLMWAPRR